MEQEASNPLARTTPEQRAVALTQLSRFLDDIMSGFRRFGEAIQRLAPELKSLGEKVNQEQK